MLSFLYRILSLLLGIIPKSKKILVFSSFPDFTDNSFAFYKYVEATYGAKYDLIWIFSDKESLRKHSSIRAYYKFTFQALYYFCRAKFVFCTHGLYSFLNLQQGYKIVNLWHGMPIKTIGCLDPKNGYKNLTKADYLVASSYVFQDIMSRAFNNLPFERVLVIGQPRNDLLFEPTDFFANRNINPNDYRSIGIWLPTYKKSFVGDVRQDGHFYKDSISFLTINDLFRLDDFLVETHRLLIVKLHPMDILQNYEFPNLRNLIVVKQKDFHEQLYPLLGACSYLLTDYSSVWIDFSILKRPIGYVIDDLSEYETSRGFTFDNLLDKLPGEILDSYDKVVSFIDNPTLLKLDEEGYFNLHCDNRSSFRLSTVLLRE